MKRFFYLLIKIGENTSWEKSSSWSFYFERTKIG